MFGVNTPVWASHCTTFWAQTRRSGPPKAILFEPGSASLAKICKAVLLYQYCINFIYKLSVSIEICTPPHLKKRQFYLIHWHHINQSNESAERRKLETAQFVKLCWNTWYVWYSPRVMHRKKSFMLRVTRGFDLHFCLKFQTGKYSWSKTCMWK